MGEKERSNTHEDQGGVARPQQDLLRTLGVPCSLRQLLLHHLVLSALLLACAMARDGGILTWEGLGLADAVEHHRCGPRTLKLNHACLRVLVPDDYDDGAAASANDRYLLEAQSEECVGCPLWTVWEGPAAEAGAGVAVNTSFATRVRLTREGANQSSCDATYHFGEYGIYGVAEGGNSSAPCEVTEIRPPVHSLAFLLYIALVLLGLRVLWLLGQFLFRTRWVRARWMYYRFGVSVDLQEDLAEDVMFVQPDQQQQQQQQDEQQQQQEPPVDSSALVPPPAPRPRARVKSIDILRGISISIMIFVNYGGGDYWFFHHAPWNGLTVADLVFPWFLFVMGVSLVFSVQSRLRRGASKKSLLASAARRSAALIFLGLFLNSGHGRNTDLRTLRLPGVLQRFGLSYMIVASVEICCMSRELPPPGAGRISRHLRDLRQNAWQLSVTAALIAAHACLTFLLPVPGCPTGYLGPGGLHDGGQYADCTGGAAGYIDRALLGDGHIYRHPTSAKIYDSHVPFDPEGLLGTLTSAALVLLGCHAGKIMLAYPSWGQRVSRWLVWALVLGLVAGFLCDFSQEGGVIPVNKNLWSISFILALASMGLVLLTML